MAKLYIELPKGDDQWVRYELRQVARINMPPSVYMGVSYDKTRGKWTARATHYPKGNKHGSHGSRAGKQKNLGYFDSPEEAAKAYDAFCFEQYGWDRSDAKFYNFPADPTEGKAGPAAA